jgi:ABC-2 type transport system permease protein
MLAIEHAGIEPVDYQVRTPSLDDVYFALTGNQPLSQAIDCIRALLTGTPLGDHLGLALAELTGVIVIAFVLAIAAFRRKTSQ